MQLNQENMSMNKEEWLPDLQLRLSQRVGNYEDEKSTTRGTETHEISTKLSLS